MSVVAQVSFSVRGRGNRITTFFTALQNVRFWHKANIPTRSNEHPDTLKQCPLLGVKRTFAGSSVTQTEPLVSRKRKPLSGTPSSKHESPGFLLAR